MVPTTTHFCLVAIVALVAAGCAAPRRSCATGSSAGAPVVYLVAEGWHANIGIPVDEIMGPLGVYRALFPHAKAVEFGYGKRSFMTAPMGDACKYLLGPLPGAGAIEAIGLWASPETAYPPDAVIALSLPTTGLAALSRFIWNDLQKETTGKPRVIEPFPGGFLYAARSEYTLLHTCNSWAIDALAAAGLPVSSGAVIFSGQAMRQAASVASAACRAREARGS